MRLSLLTLGLVLGDVYMHNPRGSNNRLNERSANRNNGDRLFDSQNNNRGGYNVGDKKDTAYNEGDTTAEPGIGALWDRPLDKDQYGMLFYEGSVLTIEWTNQHGCGGNEANDPYKLNCNIVLQYACNTDDSVTDVGMTVRLKDGRNTNTPDTTGQYSQIATTYASNDNNGRGRHESEGYYYECSKRSRNKGLFLADQKLNGESAQYTRQNPNGNRRGLECPEERDYYPYWGPTPWVDIAVLTDTLEDCDGMYQNAVAPTAYNFKSNSNNGKDIGKCTVPTPFTGDDNTAAKIFYELNQTKCIENGGTWKIFNHKVAAPACVAADWSRVNHLGNGRKPQPLTYNWTLPYFTPAASSTQVGFSQYTAIKTVGTAKIAKCVLRLRYNISTDDYDPRATNESHNNDPGNGVISPVTNNPTVDVNPPDNAPDGTMSLLGLKLALNTNQFGRTFQDRSHVFYIKSRPTEVAAAKVQTLLVRGKRGNIVQTFPSVEYDFVPNILHMSVNDFIHLQWTGSNTHNNDNPAGDGQAGDAGEGTGGTDRHNFVPLKNASLNYPVPLDTTGTEAYHLLKEGNVDCYVPTADGTTGSLVATASLTKIPANDCQMYLATSGYHKSLAEANTGTSSDFDPLLNNAYPSLLGGVLLKFKSAGTYHYMCTRNNNFSNRSQKGVIVVA